MKKLWSVGLVSLVTFCFSLPVLAADKDTSVSEKLQEKIESGLKIGRPDLKFTSVKKSKFKGLFEVQIENGPVVYTDQKADFFSFGRFV